MVIVAILLCVLVVAGLVALRTLRSSQYPSPPPMPAVVDASMATLLARLETVLQMHAPAALASMQPGLTDEAIQRLEAQGGIVLTEDLKTLYRWRNGSPASAGHDFIPIHQFLPLDEAITQRTAVQQQAGGTVLQRMAYFVFAGHRTDWLTVFDDGCGDGYFYDPDRRVAAGAFFQSFAEDGTYLFFPSIRNFMAGVIECYEKGAYRIKPDGSLDEKYDASQAIWSKYAAASF